ncbi:helix-turn-helix transcriptional regulator [Hymenobacter rubripertinctus]|uniref:YafY family transcriptional regulator n=1 Tax=Hymenobacter rubripertinctus TaxID=2029981 RepID=A0A418QR90_9BACT|nr:YafY family protein [Hymenobacter rubripertinctus]RIY07787.1 YafY family transcriptional regulator [Hymenobacter rubripertinctus]
MNRFDRITALLVQLQARRVVKGSELAARFGVSLRTIYRDLRTLEEAGVPICGEAGVGYSLAEGYRLPPVMFTREEATALLTAEKLATRLTDTEMARLSQLAMDKLRAVLRRPDRDYVEALSTRLLVLAPPRHRPALPDLPASGTQQPLLDAIAHQRVVRLDYRAGYHGTPSRRDVEPIGLYFGQYWHMVAFCRLRQDFRDFRLDRIVGLQRLDEVYAPRPDTLQTYWARLAAERQDSVAVVRFGPEALPQVHENKHLLGWRHERAWPDGWVEMTLQPGCLERLSRWLLLFAGQVQVVSPPELLGLVQARAQATFNFFCAPVRAC